MQRLDWHEGEEEYKMSIASLWTREVLELLENFMFTHKNDSLSPNIR